MSVRSYHDQNAQMSSESRRRFGLLDAMTLIGAGAVGAAINRLQWWPWDNVGSWSSPTYTTALGSYYFLLPHLWAMTNAVLALSLRGPRRPSVRLARQPGFVACSIAAVVSLLVLAWAAGLYVGGRQTVLREVSVPGRGITYGGIGMVLVSTHGDKVGYAVLGDWLCLWMGGRWEPEATWTDRMGRFLGGCWLLSLPLSWLEYFLV